MSGQEAPDPTGRDAVALLRAAAEVLRSATRTRPRGPWRWGDPEIDRGVDQEVGGRPTPQHQPWPALPPHRWPDPLDAPDPLGHGDPLFPFPDDAPPLRPRTWPATVVGPAVAEPLAALLDVVAGQVERDDHGVDPEAARAAVAVARSVLRSCPPGTTSPSTLPTQEARG
jgi:hypothetical protein